MFAPQPTPAPKNNLSPKFKPWYIHVPRDFNKPFLNPHSDIYIYILNNAYKNGF